MISIIVPTRNEEKVIGNTLKKLKEGAADVASELIVSDGMSTDGTIAIAKRYADVVCTATTRDGETIAAGKNRGAASARGEYLFFTDSDVSIPNPEQFFARALEAFRADPKLMGLTGPVRVQKEFRTFWDWLIFGALNSFHYVMNNMFHAGRAAGELQIVRASAFKKLRGYREDIAASEDYEFFTRLAKTGRTKYDPRLLVTHTGRRAHKVGWPKLLTIWILNALAVLFVKKSVSKEWEEVR